MNCKTVNDIIDIIFASCGDCDILFDELSCNSFCYYSCFSRTFDFIDHIESYLYTGGLYDYSY